MNWIYWIFFIYDELIWLCGLMIGTDTTLDLDSWTEGNCVCMYIVHRRVSVHNNLSRWLQLCCKTREQNAKVPFNKKLSTIANRFLSKQFVVSALVYNHSLDMIYCKYVLSLSSRVHGFFQSFRQGSGQSVFTKFRVASCHCFASLLLLSSPVMIISSWEVPKLVQRFHSALHPSRCSRPLLTIVCSASPICTSDVCSFQVLCDPDVVQSN